MCCATLTAVNYSHRRCPGFKWVPMCLLSSCSLLLRSCIPGVFMARTMQTSNKAPGGLVPQAGLSRKMTNVTEELANVEFLSVVTDIRPCFSYVLTTSTFKMGRFRLNLLPDVRSPDALLAVWLVLSMKTAGIQVRRSSEAKHKSHNGTHSNSEPIL